MRGQLSAIITLTAVVLLTTFACTAPEPEATPWPVTASAIAPAAVSVPTPTPRVSPTDTPTPQPTPTTTATPLPANTPAPTATPIPTPTRTPRPTNTPLPTSTPTPPSPITNLKHGAGLERNQPERAARLLRLPWVADGVDDTEREVAEDLIAAAQWYPDVFNALVAMSWVQNSAITADEARAIRYPIWAARNSPALIVRMMDFPWVRDGITDTEAQVIPELSRAIHDSPALAERMLELSWVKDSVTADEAKATEHLRRAAEEAPVLVERMLQKPWVQDDITRDEGIIIRRLSWLAGRKDEATQQRMTDVAIRLVDMPFLDDVSFAEARAVMSLHMIAGSRTQESFRAIMSHPKVQDGITDQEAKVISVLRTSAYYAPEAIPHLLDGLDGTGGVYLEERIIQLPQTGATLLTIVRTQDQTTASMGYLEHAVSFAENLMAAPLPTNYVALYYGSLGPRYGANNWWTHMAIRQSGDGLEEYARTIAHEVGHYYFRDASATWINEGTANIIHILAEHERTGSPLETHLKNRSCDSSVKTLAASELIEESGCARNLGERFFLDLYQTLGEDAFLQGFRALYRMRLVDNPNDDCFECTELSIHHVEAAFKDNASAEAVRKVDEVIARWYGPRP